MKYLFVAFVCFITLFSVKTVQAGGCCFKSFSATEGAANKEPARITAAFIDPANPYADAGKTKLSSLANKKIDIVIVSPKPGQSCTMKTSNTNDQGMIEAECTSPVAGAIKIYFEAPELESQYKQMLSSTAKSVSFSGTPVAVPTTKPVFTSAPKPSIKPMVSPSSKLEKATPSASPSMIPKADETEALQARVQELEQKVAEQEKEVTGLRAVIDKIMSAFGNFFKKD